MAKCAYIIGIDEAGRGPLAGPVSVGAVCVPWDFDWSILPGVNDSKKVSAKNREAIFCRTNLLKNEGLLDFSVSLVSAAVIDTIGITRAIAQAIEHSLIELDRAPHEVSVLLDGSLKAPDAYIHQETIIQGDAKEKVIGLASIMAKVTRDTYMTEIALQYPEYDFQIHKGYGTKVHSERISLHGLSALHRKSFCRRFL